MNNLESLIQDEFFTKHKAEFLRNLKHLILNPPSAQLVAQSYDNLEATIKDSIGFNFSPQSKDGLPLTLCISSILVDGLYLYYALYPDLRENCILLARNMISKKYVLSSMILERTESDFIKAVGVSGDVATFDKKYIRANTAYLYTQSKFNLLREESQGFTKLLVLLSENNIPSVDALWTPPISQSDGPSITMKEIRETRSALVKAAAEKVMDEILRLIGTFELDSNRVLDLILDVFAARIVNSYDFFIELLRISPW